MKCPALWRNSEEAPVLCGGCSFAIRDICKFLFAVLKEDGQFLEGFVSASGGGADEKHEADFYSLHAIFNLHCWFSMGEEISEGRNDRGDFGNILLRV